jgi:hypothetical protein
MIGLPLMVAAVACLVALVGFGETLWLFLAFVVCLHFAFALLLLPALTAGRARKEYRSGAGTFPLTTLMLTTEGISTEDATSRTESGWESVLVVIDSPRGLMFCGAGYKLLFFLPARVLADGARDDVLSLLNSVAVNVRPA